jgi:hypothetical protein
MIDRSMTNNEMEKGKKGTVNGYVNVVRAIPDPRRFK